MSAKKTIHKTVVVLLHYPVTNRAGEPVTTSVTNLDIHDIARSCRTYEVDHYYIVNPILEQTEMVERILSHWREPRSKEWHPDRFDALSRIQLVAYFNQVKEDLAKRYPGVPIEVTLPDARPLPGQLSYRALREVWEKEGVPSVKIVVLGTGGGVAEPFYPEVNRFLAPIYGPLGVEGYNHLSVRAAAAIILDRLFGLSD